MDNPLTKRGSDVYQPKQPVNLTYDAFGPPAGFLRGLFEYLYRADGLTLVPHIPPSVTELEQLDPVRFGKKKLLLSVVGNGAITAVRVNGRKWKSFDGTTVFLPYDKTPELARVEIFLGGRKPSPHKSAKASTAIESANQKAETSTSPVLDEKRIERIEWFYRQLASARLDGTYEAAHAKLILDCAQVVVTRQNLLNGGRIPRLPEPSQIAADKSYAETVTKLCNGLESVMQSYERSPDRTRRKIFQLWRETGKNL